MAINQNDLQTKLDEAFNIVERTQKFEELLIANNLFADYFNEFLSNPGFGEKVRYNFMTGDLELIDGDEGAFYENAENNESKKTSRGDKAKKHANKQRESENELNIKIKKKADKQPQLPRLTSTAEGVKRKLESQLKSIFKNQQSGYNNEDQAFLSRSYTAISLNQPDRPVLTRNNTSKEIIRSQINNHSFKDIDLIPIKPWIDPTKLKDPKAAREATIPVINNSYSVKIIKKPFSMKWLRNRRLTLFVQSEHYNEFKLSMILSQFGMFNYDLVKDKDETKSNLKKQIFYTQIELDDDILEMKLNPFKAKSDFQKLHESNTNGLVSESTLSFGETKVDEPKKKQNQIEIAEFNPSAPITPANKKILIENGKEVYKSLKENYKTSLLINRESANESRESVSSELSAIENNPIVINSVKDMARILIDSVMSQAVNEVSGIGLTNKEDLQRNYRYSMTSSSAASDKPVHVNRQVESSLNDFNFNKSNSKMGYYKDYETDIDLNAKQGKAKELSYVNEERKIKEKYAIEFKDEPYELNDLDIFEEISLRREEIENFKKFLKENDAFLFYRLWIDIDKIKSIIDPNDRLFYIKKLKLTYNQPSILNRINDSYNLFSNNKKSKYLNMYSQYEKNVDFWSFDYLNSVLQKRLLHILINYWWPKYCIRLESFQDYIRQKYPNYYFQKNITDNSTKSKIDIDSQNIEKSIFYKFTNEEYTSGVSSKFSKMSANTAMSEKSKNVKTSEYTSFTVTKKYVTREDPLLASDQQTAINAPNKRAIMLEGYQTNNHFKTSLPVGWKRPPSKATVMVDMMLENSRRERERDQNKSMFLNRLDDINNSSRNRMDKEIYLEAIYREDIGGQIFMKYLSNKNKLFATNRLKCLQDLIKYKDLFYDDLFNQELAKKSALDIYSKYIAVSASHSIDCSKPDRLKIHFLFTNQISNSVNMENSSSFKPVYEDTFDSIEEFLLVSLYDEWKMLMETEQGYFRHNEIENIERIINIRSKELDELIERDQVRMSTKIDQSNLGIRCSSARLRRSSGQFDQMHSINNQHGASFLNSQSSLSLKQATTSTQSLKSVDLNEFLTNTRDFEMFKKFLESNNSINDLHCWMDIEAFSRIEATEQDEIENAARNLRKKYLNKKYLFAKNGPIDEDTQNLILEKIGGWNVLLEDLPPTLLIILAKKYLERKLKNHWLPLYQNSDYSTRSNYMSRTPMMDVVDDVLYLKNKQPVTKEYSKMKKRRWLYSSQVIINFNKALRNTFTVKLFSRFLGLKTSQHGVQEFDFNTNNLVNDLQFLVQVLEYKDLCQKYQTDEQTILAKVKHIVSYFIDHRIPPKIRIDIPDEVAKKIIEQKDYVSAYLFLEANLIVFNMLIPYWIEFNKMRSGKELDLFDEFNSFKKLKDFRPSSAKRAMSANNNEEFNSSDDHSVKWRYNQYIKALKTQLVI